MYECDYEDVIKRINPFGIREMTGLGNYELIVFEDYGKCYLHTLKFLRTQFLKGFIDVPLALSMMTRVAVSETRTWLRKMMIETDHEIYLCPWEDDKEDVKKRAEMLLRSIHVLTDTKFSTDYFNWAWYQFKEQTP